MPMNFQCSVTYVLPWTGTLSTEKLFLFNFRFGKKLTQFPWTQLSSFTAGLRLSVYAPCALSSFQYVGIFWVRNSSEYFFGPPNPLPRKIPFKIILK